MGIALDIVLFTILSLSILVGYKKGLIGVVFNLCAFLIAIIVTWILYTPVTNLIINNTEIDDNLKSTIIEKGAIKENNQEPDNKVNEYLQEYVSVPATKKANEAIEQTAGVIAEKVVAIVVGIVLFIVVRIALILVKFLIEGIANLPIIKQFDKAGGVIYGVIIGLFIIYVILAILFFIMSLNNSGMVADLVNSSFISKYLYENNIILNIIF